MLKAQILTTFAEIQSQYEFKQKLSQKYWQIYISFMMKKYTTPTNEEKEIMPTKMLFK